MLLCRFVSPPLRWQQNEISVNGKTTHRKCWQKPANIVSLKYHFIMKAAFLFFLSLWLATYLPAQKVENIIIVTTDGFRWQELYTGMDSTIANNQKFNEGDSAYIYAHYWALHHRSGVKN
jgi:hypothetical protein